MLNKENNDNFKEGKPQNKRSTDVSESKHLSSTSSPQASSSREPLETEPTSESGKINKDLRQKGINRKDKYVSEEEATSEKSKNISASPQNLLHIRVTEQQGLEKFSNSVDNLSTRVNASSGGSSQASDPDVSSGSDSPVPHQPINSSPEPLSANESPHRTQRNDTRAITPIVSSDVFVHKSYHFLSICNDLLVAI